VYTALYRQWRPETFKDVVGQDTIVRTLKNQINSSRIAHAYLFCGSRGTGKTSTAKIFARAINCESLTEDGPCGICQTCANLSSGNNMDIMEIDAASNNGVDEIRDLREKVRFSPTIGKYKVYIIDEVHMLSMGAFNALLKTLEEPPGHVVFILATTEPQKLPATILSRCQRYNFKRISINVIVERMNTICSKLQLSVEEEALYTIARWAEGGMRDALSLLDQCIGLSGDTITNEDVLSVLGTADQGFIFNTADYILKGNIKELLKAINMLIDDGKDISVFIKVLTNHIRDILIIKYCDEPEKLLDVAVSTINSLQEQAKEAREARLVRAVETLSSLEADIKWSTQPRVMVELAMVKICRPEDENSMDALLDRIEVLEDKVKRASVVFKTGDASDSNNATVKEQKQTVYNATDTAMDTSIDEAYMDVLPPEDYAPSGDYIPNDDINASARDLSPAVNNKNNKNKSSNRVDRSAESNNVSVSEAVRQYSPVKGDTNNSEPQGTETSATDSHENIRVKDQADDQRGSVAKKDPVMAWPEIAALIRKERIAVYSLLKDVKPRLKDNRLVLNFPETQGFFVAALDKEENRNFISGLVERVTGHKLTIKCQLEDKIDVNDTTKDNNDYTEKKAVEVFGDYLEIVDE